MSAAQLAARVIPAIGRSDFSERLLSVYRELAGCDLCSAFVWESESGPRLLLAAGVHPQIPGFALSASRAYAQTYWRFDAAAQESVSLRVPSLLRTNAEDIPDPNYRTYCYQRGGICERWTLFDTESPTVSLSGYRTVSRGPMTSLVAKRMEDAMPTLVAALRRHFELVECESRSVPARSVLVERAREWGLSAREAEVAAGLATGQSQSDIAKSAGLTLNSVITYRRRAYQKLKVGDRTELRAMCARLAAREVP